MERDERGRASNGQTDATPQAVGFWPTRDQMRTIVAATVFLRGTLDEWQRHSALPGYPQDEGVGLAMDALFRLERTVNPRRQHWQARQAARPNIHVWPRRMRTGLLWARGLTADILERNRLQWMADATREDFQARLEDPASLPETISIEGDELQALDGILELLPHLNGLLHPPEQPVEAETPAPVAPAIAPTPEHEDTPGSGFPCSKRKLNRSMGVAETNSDLIPKLLATGELTLDEAPYPNRRWQYLARFRDPEEHRRREQAYLEIVRSQMAGR